MRKPMFLTLVLLICSISIVQAQTDDCPVSVREALQSVAGVCADFGRNSACYGAPMVDANTTIQPRPDDFFRIPGDRAELIHLSEIHPQPLDPATRTFGVGVLNAQADIPNTLPGQGVVFMLMGDARITNEVPVGSTQSSPFQAFYFLPGTGQADCYEAEPMMTIQTPTQTAITINFNGVHTEMAPGTLLTITQNVCTVHRGSITQTVGDKSDTLGANLTVDIHYDENGGVVVDNLRGISQREYQRGERVQDTLNTLASANDWDQQTVTPPDEFAQEPADTQSACAVQHTVVHGETLYRIARNYETSIQAIADINGLANPRLIYPGQVLCIPDPGSGFKPLPPGVQLGPAFVFAQAGQS